MEVVVLNSDIARLVLGYLKNHGLEKASRVFCKSSPYLQQEFSAYKQGFQAYSFFPELEEIICEYVKISRKVEQILYKVPDSLRNQIYSKKLSEKVIELLDRGIQAFSDQSVLHNKSENKVGNSSTCTSVQSDKENNFNTCNNQRKRKRNSALEISEDLKIPTSECTNVTKKKRYDPVEPFCFLNTKSLSLRFRKKFPNFYTCKGVNNSSESSNHEDDEGEEEEEEEEEEEDTEYSTEDDRDNSHELDGDFSLVGRPTTESTPHEKSVRHYQRPSLPEISQAILENPEFHTKLAENINLALNANNNLIGANSNEISVKPGNTNDNFTAMNNIGSANDTGVTTGQLLDELVKQILDATEKDPTFDAIIEEVLEASNKSQISAGVQCDILSTNECGQMATTVSASEANNLIENCVPRTPHIIRAAVASVNADASNNTTSDINRNNIDGHSITATNLNVNNSFGSLIDPNFSISKLIVLNSNDSAQKNHPDQTIGNTTADNLINQLTTGPVPDDQVYFDATTGQLTFPLLLSTDGLFANLPFLSNNEIITQHLQADNLANMESRIEIPLPEPIVVTADQLPPNSIIVGSAQKNQLAQQDQQQQQAMQVACRENKTATELSANVCNQRTISKLKDSAVCSAVPSSLDSRLNIEKVTPSASGIVNVKAFRSLSTPRKRTAHVRTLNFSPRPNVQTIQTPSSSKFAGGRLRNMIMKDKDLANESLKNDNEAATIISERPIIKNIEILPRLTTNAIDSSANESSNSCNVPPLFIGEETSNQTVIEQRKVNVKVPANTYSCSSHSDDTPKRKQHRSIAVRSCKRQISQSPPEDSKDDQMDALNIDTNNDDVKTIKKKATKSKIASDSKTGVNDKNKSSSPTGVSLSAKTSSKHNKNELKYSSAAYVDNEEATDLMEAWRRMRTLNQSDLDTRLRALNAKNIISQRKDTRRKNRRKKLNTSGISKKQRRIAAEAAAKAAEERQEFEKLAGVITGEDNLLDTSTESKNNEDNENINHSSEPENVEEDKDKSKDAETMVVTDVTVNSNDTVECKQKDKAKPLKVKCIEKNEINNTDKRRTSKDKQKEFNIKIPTPQKSKTTKSGIENASRDTIDSDEQLKEFSISCSSFVSSVHHSPPHTITMGTECEKRTANIACLLETPFKIDNLCSSFVPPTPGIFAPSLDTPMSKGRNDTNSTSYIFGSLTKSELDTPLLSAITPGIRFTPFGSKDITPRSGTNTESSSVADGGGSSYYKPDESDDLDRKFDKMLKDSTQDQRSSTEDIEQNQQQQQQQQQAIDGDIEAIVVKIPTEKITVQRNVLKRVKSFGSEAILGDVENAAATQIDPHYTLASGLPDICPDEESSSSSSSSSASSSSTSSATSSTSSSRSSNSSSSSSASSSNSPKSSKTLEASLQISVKSKSRSKTPQPSLSLENLSEISSTEDDDWQKLNGTDQENTQLIANDGEIRYPVRSWLTPSKEKAEAITFTLKSTEKKNIHAVELNEKRLRIKEKLKQDSKVGAKPIAVKNKTTREVAREQSRTIRAKAVKLEPPHKLKIVNVVTTNLIVEEERPIDVLTALNLSARVTEPPDGDKNKKTASNKNVMSNVITDIDDNAVSNVINPNATTNANTKSITTGLLGLKKKPLIQRKCVQIDALPVIKKRRSTQKIAKVSKEATSATNPTTSTSHTQNVLNVIGSPLQKLPLMPKIKITPSREYATKSGLRCSTRLSKAKLEKEKKCKEVEEIVKSYKGAFQKAKTVLKKEKESKNMEGELDVCKQTKATKCKELKKEVKEICRKLSTENKKPEDTETIHEEEKSHDKNKGLLETEYQQLPMTSNGKGQGQATDNEEKIKIIEKNIIEKSTESVPTLNVTAIEASKDLVDGGERVEKLKKPTTSNDDDELKTKKTKSQTEKTKRTKPDDDKDSVKNAKTDQNTNEIELNANTAEHVEIQQPPVPPSPIIISNALVSLPQPQMQTTKTENVMNDDEGNDEDNQQLDTSETSDDDIMDLCELTSITEDDEKRYISMVYNGPDDPPKQSSQYRRHSFAKFCMIVNIENESHVWKMSDEHELYTSKPLVDSPAPIQTIPNKPKKCKIRVVASPTKCITTKKQSQVRSTAEKTNTNTAATDPEKACTPKQSISTKPAAASTPLPSTTAKKSQTKDKCTKDVKKESVLTSQEDDHIKIDLSPKKLAPAPKPSFHIVASVTTPLKAPTNPIDTDKIQIEDIESILSHLHGS